MRHVILGGCGFTGRHLAERLGRMGERVLLVDLPEVAAQAPVGADLFAADLRDAAAVARIPLDPADVVHHHAARQFHGTVPWRGRDAWFAEVNVAGTRHVLQHMERRGCRRMVCFSTDMVYGLPTRLPVPVDHPQRPLGPYGRSKREMEKLCRRFRERSFNITIFRPRLIVGPGRLGILAKLFGLIRRNLPVPLIGKGVNQYQMVSVFDCVSAIEAALANSIPNREYNLGSLEPPLVKDLLRSLIDQVGSRSILLPTPGPLVKAVLATLDGIGIPLLYPEQFRIADVTCLVDTSATVAELGWRPRYDDRDMLLAAYREATDGRAG